MTQFKIITILFKHAIKPFLYSIILTMPLQTFL